MIRIVKMTFDEQHSNDFLNHFDTIKEKIASMPGCKSLRLHQDKEQANIFFTYSYWNTNDDLQYYRKSELFKETWKKIKVWFAEPAQAWSVNTIFDSEC